MLYEVLGDMWVVKRNPYIEDDLLGNRKRRAALIEGMRKRLAGIEARRENPDQRVAELLAAAQTAVDDFEAEFEDTPALSRALQRTLTGGSTAPVAYTVRGSLGAALPRVLPDTRIEFILQEIGTWSTLRVLRALREENRWHHYGDGHTGHPAKQPLREALCPAAPAWREAAVAHGCDLVYRAAGWLFRGDHA